MLLYLCVSLSRAFSCFVFREHPNTLSLVDNNGTVMYKTDYDGPHQYDLHPELKIAYHAFAPSGNVTVSARLELCRKDFPFHQSNVLLFTVSMICIIQKKINNY